MLRSDVRTIVIAHALLLGAGCTAVVTRRLVGADRDRLAEAHHRIDHAVFLLVVAMRRHGRRAPGLGQRLAQICHRLSGIAVEHVEDRKCRHQPVVVATAERRIEEEVPGLLEPREGAIWFDRDQVRSAIPLDGQRLQIENSRDAVLEHWLDDDGVDLLDD